MMEKPINLGKLQSLNLRSKLFKQLKQFETNQREAVDQGTIDAELESNRLRSTHDSIFGPTNFHNKNENLNN